ncbi:MAG: AmmeMemoRadiSam system radical SAM enzyme [Clostridiales bacterium]|nr:AmmeMemoRadiSam system radical SAM enzyme [Clostridiales bacterium]
MSAAECGFCPHRCRLAPGQTGRCRARSNVGGSVVSDSYGFVTALALDPIEKKPLYHFHPGSRILSAGSFGCNMDCPFCQNSHISMAGADSVQSGRKMAPEELVEAALSARARGNIGLAYTYNEPLVGYEFVKHSAILAAEAGLQNVLVTNGYVCREPLLELLPYIHGMNIDLKGFREEYYAKLGGGLETVKETITLASAACHVEVTTLIVPGENDDEGEIGELAAWLAGLSPDIPYHVSRFFPRWKMQDREPTPVKTIYEMANIARRHLCYVYEGNC